MNTASIVEKKLEIIVGARLRDNKEVESIVEDAEKFLVRIKEVISGIQKWWKV